MINNGVGQFYFPFIIIFPFIPSFVDFITYTGLQPLAAVASIYACTESLCAVLYRLEHVFIFDQDKHRHYGHQ